MIVGQPMVETMLDADHHLGEAKLPSLETSTPTFPFTPSLQSFRLFASSSFSSPSSSCRASSCIIWYLVPQYLFPHRGSSLRSFDLSPIGGEMGRRDPFSPVKLIFCYEPRTRGRELPMS